MKAAVVGANGFLGRNLVLDLLSKEYEVYALYNNNAENIPDKCHKIQISKLANITSTLDYLFIAIGNHLLSQEAFEEQYTFMKFLLENMKFKKVIYVSSVAVYGIQKEVITEGTVPNDISLYGLSKEKEEQLIFAQRHYAVIRFTYLYGSGMDKNSLIPKMCKQAKSQGVIFVYGDGSRCQDYLEVTDAVTLLVRAAYYEENALFIGATGKSIPNRVVANEIANSIPNTRIEYIKEDHTPSFFYNIEKAKTELSWQPLIEFSFGIKKMIQNDLANL